MDLFNRKKVRELQRALDAAIEDRQTLQLDKVSIANLFKHAEYEVLNAVARLADQYERMYYGPNYFLSTATKELAERNKLNAIIDARIKLDKTSNKTSGERK